MSAVKHRKEKDCLNCGHLVEEKFCTHCGQENLVTKEKAWAMVTHAIADYFHFEHKFFSTMRPLLLKPGWLTKEYVSGKRASFIHPIRLYIFISIVFFLVILSGSKSEDKHDNVNIKTRKDLVLDSAARVEEKKKEDSVAVAAIKDAIDNIPGQSERKERLKRKLSQLETGKEQNNQPKYTPDFDQGYVLSQDSTYEAWLTRINKLPEDQRPGMIMKYVAKNQIKFRGEDGKKKFLESLLHNIPKMMFILLPLFAAMLHVFYIRKKKYYYEDLIYSFHLHSSIFLSILFFKLLNWLIGFAVNITGWLVLLLVIYICWYIYRSLRTFYNSSRWRTILKIGFLSFGYLFLLTISFLIIAAFTVVSL